MDNLKKDKDREPILFTEDFKKSKRNALFWISFVVLLALASIENGQKLTLGVFLKDAAFDADLLIALSWGVMAFMALGYHRADRRLISQHTQFRLDLRSAAETSSEAHPDIMAANELKLITDLAQNMKKEIADLVGNSALVYKETKKLVEKMQISKIRINEDFGRAKQNQLMVFREIDQLLYHGDYDIMEMRRIISEKLNALPPPTWDVSDRLMASVERICTPQAVDPNLASEVQGIVDKIDGLCASLHGLSDDISNSEKRWLLWYDRAPVYGGAFISTILAITAVCVN